jgi:pimeloyl-ACP methyl ester carboxylesterase
MVGVGHSLGSLLTNALTAKYPRDLDAAVLTGLSFDSASQKTFFGGLNLAISRQNQPGRFYNLPNGYKVSDSIISNQFGFLHYPGFSYSALLVAEATRGTFTIGELYTNGQFVAPAMTFTGPIDVIEGEFDLPFSEGNCLVPMNKVAAVKAALYPNASNGSQYYIAEGAGHGINSQDVAPKAYEHIFSFLAANGL